MRLRKLTVEGFRGFGKQEAFDLDTDIVLLGGRNGFGKTSFFDAIVFALFGRVNRLVGTRDAPRDQSTYLENCFHRGSLKVELSLEWNGRLVSIVRRLSEFHLSVEKQQYSGSEAEARLQRILVKQEAGEAPHSDAEDLFYRSCLLEQDTLADFVRSRPRERYDVVARLLRVSFIREAYRHLGDERDKWNSLVSELQQRVNREDALLTTIREEKHLHESRWSKAIGAMSRDQALEAMLLSLNDAAVSLDFNTEITQVPTIDPEGKILEICLKLEALTREKEQRLATDLENIAKMKIDIPNVALREQERAELVKKVSGLQTHMDRFSKEAETSKSELTRISEKEAEIHRLVEAEAARLKGLRQLLDLARIHVTGDQCPVCQQSIAQSELLIRLNRVVGKEDKTTALTAQLEMLAKQRDTLGKQLAINREQYTSIRREDLQLSEKIAQLDTQQAWFLKRSEELLPNVPAGDFTTMLERKHKELIKRSEVLSKTLSTLLYGRACLQLLASDVESSERRGRIEGLEQALENLKTELSVAKRKHDLATSLEEALRAAEDPIVTRLFDSYKPIINQIYARLRPHPLFRELGMKVGRTRQGGELFFEALHKSGRSVNTTSTFSSAQLNSVALSVFLAMSYQQSWSNWNVILLDDPIQNMDDLNVVGLLDMLRYLVQDRQLIVSTHDTQLLSLMENKLRPLADNHLLRVFEFQSYGESGPTVIHRDQEFVARKLVVDTLEQVTSK